MLVVHFGNGELAAYDFAGERLSARNLQDDYGQYSIWWGHANSPVLFQDLVISVSCRNPLSDLGKTQADSYLVAHDKHTGELKWKSARMTGAEAEQGDSYTTPVLCQTPRGWQLIVMGGNQLDGYDPATGAQLLVSARHPRRTHHHRPNGRARNDICHPGHEKGLTGREARR